MKCAKAYTLPTLEYYIRQMEQIVPSIKGELAEVGYNRWSRAFSINNRYILMTTNTYESLNSNLTNAHELPIIPLLESIRVSTTTMVS